MEEAPRNASRAFVPAPAACRWLQSHPAAAVFAAYSALTILLTWPLAANVASVVPSNVGDPILNTWILWWNASTVPLTEAWWNPPALFPASGVMAFSEHLLGLTVISSPVIWLSGNPLLGYNVTFLLTFPLAAMAAYLLGLELTGRRDAAFLAGLAFGFAPYRIAHFSHIQILASYWMPLALLGLHRYLRHGHARWLALFGGAWLMQALSNGYFLAYFSVFIGLWVAWFVPLRDWRKGVRIGAAWVVAAIPLIPIVWGYRATHDANGFFRHITTIRSYSADLMAWLDSSALLTLGGHLRVYHRAEGELFTGVTILAIIALGVARHRARRPTAGLPGDSTRGRPVLAFYIVAAMAMYALALGPSLTFLGTPMGIPGPYAWLLRLPGFDGLRVPARFAMIMIVCLSAAMAVGYARMGHGWSRIRRLSTAGALGAMIVAESWIGTMPLWDEPRPWDITAEEVTTALLVLPVLNELNDAASMYRAMAHGKPLVNGYSGYQPPWYYAMKDGLNARDPAVLDELSRAGVTQIAIVTRNDKDGIWDDYVRTRATVARKAADGSFVLYNLPAQRGLPPREFHRTVPVAAIQAATGVEAIAALTDGDLETRWRTGPQSGGEQLIVDLGSVVPVSAVELLLGRYVLDYPRELVVEISRDGIEWTEEWHGRGDVPAIVGGFRAPRQMPLLLDLGDHVARFIRLRQVGKPNAAGWAVAELLVYAPPG